MKTASILATTVIVVAGIVPVANAGTAYEPRTEVVQYTTFEATHATGAALLFKRMSSAAQSVCRDLQPRSLSMKEKYQGCVQLALENAVSSLDSPAVTAYTVSRGAEDPQ